MKKSILSIAIILVAILSFAQDAKYNDTIGLSLLNNNNKVVQCKNKYIYSGDTLILSVEYFYGQSKGLKHTELTATKQVYNYNQNKKDSLVFNYQSGILVFEKSVGVVHLKKDTTIKCSFEPFNPEDSLHRSVMLSNSKFHFRCNPDTIKNQGDSISVSVSIDNEYWSFCGKVKIGGTAVDSITINNKQPLNSNYAIPNEMTDVVIELEGELKHDYFGFNGIIASKRIYVKDSGNKSTLQCIIDFLINNIIYIIISILLIVIILCISKKYLRPNEIAKIDCEHQDQECNSIGLVDKILRKIKTVTQKKCNNNESESQPPHKTSPNLKVEDTTDLKSEIEKLKRSVNQKDSEINKLTRQKCELEIKLAKEEKNVKTIAQQRDQFHQGIQNKLKEDIERKNKVIENERNETLKIRELYNTKTNENRQLNNDLSVARTEIDNLKEAQEKFTSRITFVPFAERYCCSIQQLIDVANKIKKEANILCELPTIDDPWHIIKAISKFSLSIWNIDMEKFYSEVSMVSRGQVVLNDTMLSKCNIELSSEELNNSMKNYFFDTYLQCYVDALVVFNESLAGLSGLTKGIPNSAVAKFDKFRLEIAEILTSLEITVHSVKLFEDIGQKLDLQVEMGDFGEFQSGSILEIENCIVYLTGAKKPSKKIKVKVQE